MLKKDYNLIYDILNTRKYLSIFKKISNIHRFKINS